MENRNMENSCFGEASHCKQAKEKTMGQIYAYEKAKRSGKEMASGSNTNTDIHQLKEAENLQKKIESESYKIMQTYEQYKTEINVKKQAYMDAVETCKKQSSEILRMTKANEHLSFELESELKNREMLVMKVNNSHEIYRTLATHFDHTGKNLKEFYSIKEAHEKRFSNLGEECTGLKADFSVLKDKFETERVHLRALVTEEHEKRILDIQQSNKQIQLSEQRVTEKMNLLRDEQHKNLKLLKVLENNEAEIKDLRESSEQLIQQHQQMTTKLNAALEHTRMEISQLKVEIERYQGVELEYKKLLPAFNTVEKEKIEALQRLIATETTLKSVETEKDDFIQKLECATNEIAKTQDKNTEVVKQLESAKSVIEMTQKRKEEILSQLGTAEHSIKSLESEHAVTLEHFQEAKATIEDKDIKMSQMTHQLEIAESLLNSMKMEKTEIVEQLKLAECAFETAEKEKLGLNHQLQLANTAKECVEKEKSTVIHQLQLATSTLECVEEEKSQIYQQLQILLTSLEDLKIEKADTSNQMEQLKANFEGLQISISELEHKLLHSENEKSNIQLKLSEAESSLSLMDKDIQTLNTKLKDAKSTIDNYTSEKDEIIHQLDAANTSNTTLIMEKKELLANLESAEINIRDTNNEKMEILLMIETIEEKKCLMQQEMENAKLASTSHATELSGITRELESKNKAIAEYQAMEVETKAQLASQGELIAQLSADKHSAQKEIEKAAYIKREERKYIHQMAQKSKETIMKYKDVLMKKETEIAKLKAQIQTTPTNSIAVSQEILDTPPALVRKSRLPASLPFTPRSCLKSGINKSPSPKRVKFEGENEGDSSDSELVRIKRKHTLSPVAVPDVKKDGMEDKPASDIDPKGISPKTNPFMLKALARHRSRLDKQRKEKK